MVSICPFLCPLEAMCPAAYAVCILLQRLFFSVPWCLKWSFGFSSEWGPYSINQNVIAITRQRFEVKLLECELSWSTSMHKRLDSQEELPSGECLLAGEGGFPMVEKVLSLVRSLPNSSGAFREWFFWPKTDYFSFTFFCFISNHTYFINFTIKHLYPKRTKAVCLSCLGKRTRWSQKPSNESASWITPAIFGMSWGNYWCILWLGVRIF